MRIALSQEFRARLHRVVRKAGRKEVGGVLMAEQLEPGHFRLIDFSLDEEMGGAAHFVRSVEHHQTALFNFFKRTGSDYGRYNYLGEWHSHPNHLPFPSPEDVRAMESLVDGERDIPFALLLVVRADSRRLACSATLFQQTISPEPVAIHLE